MDIDSKIKELLAVVASKKEKIAEQENVKRSKWLTNCSFPMPNANQNIQTANKDQLISMVEYMLNSERSRKEAQDALGLPEQEFKFGAFSKEAWLADCKKRLAVIDLVTEQRSLDELEAKLNLLVSPEQRRAMELEAIMKQMGQ